MNGIGSNLTDSIGVPVTVDSATVAADEPVLLKGLAADWPAVQAGNESAAAMRDYLAGFYNGKPLTASYGDASIAGRIGYNDNFDGFNFEAVLVSLDDYFARLFATIDEAQPPASYIGSTLVDQWFPGFRAQNDLDIEGAAPIASLWIGNQIRVSAHFDFPDNIACCVAGRRRFTLFPPDQLENLYVGPWDRTPAGQAISLVDLHNPDYERYPKIRDALKVAREFTLEPGDALFIPSMWWHHVEGLDGLNVLANYWWRSTPAYMGAPQNALKLALLSLRGLPPAQREAWRNIFEYYVFNPRDQGTVHIPEQARGMLGDIDEQTARQLRAELLSLLNR